MKNFINLILSVVICLTFFQGCSKNEGDKKDTPATEQKQTEKTNIVSAEYFGNYHGIQKSYNMKNQYGDDMVIKGKKVTVPSIDFKFLLKENGEVNLQQSNLEDNTRYYYDGSATVKSENAKSITVECAVSDGKSSSPMYTLIINKSDKSGICKGNNEPEFKVDKIK